MHSAHRLKEGAAFVDDHRVDVVPVTKARWQLEIVGRLRGEGGDEAHNSREKQAQPSAPLDPRPPGAISDSIVGADAHPDVAHGASPVISTVGIVLGWNSLAGAARSCAILPVPIVGGEPRLRAPTVQWPRGRFCGER